MRQAYDDRQDVEEDGSEIPPPLGESVYAPLRLTWSSAECPSLHWPRQPVLNRVTAEG